MFEHVQLETAVTGSQTILIIRHAEKPESGGDGAGVDELGREDAKSLTPRGWIRTGAWAELFVPSLTATTQLPTPTAIFASAPSSDEDPASGGSRSKRPLETIAALGAKLAMPIDLRFSKGEELQLASAISAIVGVVLVCWQHEDIAAIANGLKPSATGVPNVWPDDRFNVMFRFDRPGTDASWSFTQIVPFMLEGDQRNAL